MVETRRQAAAHQAATRDTNANISTNGKDVSGKEGKGGERLPRVMWVVSGSLIIDLLAFTMILPLLPALLDYYGTHDKVRPQLQSCWTTNTWDIWSLNSCCCVNNESHKTRKHSYRPCMYLGKTKTDNHHKLCNCETSILHCALVNAHVS